jgi:hypothetical protein
MTLHPAYAATRISSNLKGSTKQFGWLQAPATIRIDNFTVGTTSSASLAHDFAATLLRTNNRSCHSSLELDSVFLGL